MTNYLSDTKPIHRESPAITVERNKVEEERKKLNRTAAITTTTTEMINAYIFTYVKLN